MKKPIKLRLILWEDCNRNCFGCCNNDYNIEDIPQVKNFEGYKEILVTGGEPFLYPDKLFRYLWTIRTAVGEETKIYVYTANYVLISHIKVWEVIDGLTITIHEQEDVNRISTLFTWLQRKKEANRLEGKQLRLNIFKGIEYPESFHEIFKIKDNIQWLKNCPLPEGEVLMRWNHT